jgi:hypothetical protein
MSSPLIFEYMQWVITDLYDWKVKKEAPDYVKKAFEAWQKENDMSI